MNKTNKINSLIENSTQNKYLKLFKNSYWCAKAKSSQDLPIDVCLN